MSDPFQDAADDFNSKNGGSKPSSAPKPKPQDTNDPFAEAAAEYAGNQPARSPVPADSSPSLGGFVSNLGNSAANFAGSVGNALLHPVDTVTGAYQLASGATQNILRDASLGLIGGGPPTKEQQMASAASQYLRQRYGGFDELKHTAYTDPVGFAADISTALGGTGLALNTGMGLAKAAKMARTADVLADLAKAVTAASDATNPMMAVRTGLNLGGGAVKAVGTLANNAGLNRVGPALTRTGEIVQAPLAPAKAAAASDLYQSALQPSKQLGPEGQQAVVDMGLENGIPLNDKAPAKAQAIANEANQEIAGKLAGLNDQVDPNQVAAIAAQHRARLISADPQADLTAFDSTIQRYLDEHTPPAAPQPAPTGLLGPNGQPLPQPAAPPTPSPQPYAIQDAQKEKTGTYKKVNNYGEQSGAQQEALKGLARGLKESIEQFFPELQDLNQKQAKALDLQASLENFVASEGNKGRLYRFLRPSMGSIGFGLLAGAESHNPAVGLAAHLATKALEDPAIRSRLATTLYDSAREPGAPYIRRTILPITQIEHVKKMIQHPEALGQASDQLGVPNQ